ncbi:uncharacterized protein A4U43_C04F3930 [Asparagus officinalis]|uniref:Protein DETOXIFICATION n=1 Tax=Asparagus officinalis TaxID=4686 RepID=A0A5P1EYS3_ASPOF|nr:uncharacterized protein A4U43_C04F3930 [Asparagus officinalis]
MGVTGAAVAQVVSQYLITLILFCRLVKQIDVVPPSIKALNLSQFLRCVLGVVLALALGLGTSFGSRIFTNDVNMLKIVLRGLPVLEVSRQALMGEELTKNHGFVLGRKSNEEEEEEEVEKAMRQM